MNRRRSTRAAALRAVVAAAGGLLLLALSPVAAHADAPWGTTGASYRSGIICALPDGRRVALTSWAVDGTTAFSTADVVARGSSFGRAPSSGAAGDLAPGTRGLAAADLAALAYLVGHGGAGTPAQVAETSALVGRTFGSGTAQQRCLGQQGTSQAAANALATDARRFAGPYRVLADAVQAKPGSSAPVTATVLSAAGVPTPGIAVTFDAAGQSAGGITGRDGRASARLTVPSGTATGVLGATVSEPIGLQLIDSTPASVTLASPTPVVARAVIVPVLHPNPRLSIAGGNGLVLAGGALTPTVTVTGTYGYSGTATIGVVGPVPVPAGGTCSDASFANAPTVWRGTLAVTGDGVRPAGTTGPLPPGCYAFTGSLATTDATPAVTVQAAPDPAHAVGVSALQVTQSVGSGLARAGVLTATVTATSAAGASVSSTLTTYGPLPVATGGRCDVGVTWTGARPLARSAPVTLAAQGSDRLTAALRSPAVTATGCYALVTSSIVTQDGRSATVSATPGAAGTTVTVIAPVLHVTNSAYDGRQGVPMAGTVRVTGTLGLPGTVAVGLVSAPAPVTGCHQVVFPVPAAGASAPGASTAGAPAAGTTSLATDGDGDYRFSSPVPSQNRCYGVVATLAMSADTAVRFAAPAPGDTAIFLAGAVPPVPEQVTVHTATVQPATHHELAVLGVTAAVVLAVALALMVAAAVAGERKPDPRAGELLVDFSASASPPTA